MSGKCLLWNLVEGPMQHQKGMPSIEEGESKEDIHGIYSC